MRLFAVVIITLFFCACEQVGKLDARLYDSTEANMPVTSFQQLNEIDRQENLPEKEGAERLLLKAIGTEPGWFAEFYNNRVRMMLDYGKDSLSLYDDKFEEVSNDKGFRYKKEFDRNGKKVTLEVEIRNAPCTDPSGNTVSRTAQVRFMNKVYKGCGLVVD